MRYTINSLSSCFFPDLTNCIKRSVRPIFWDHLKTATGNDSHTITFEGCLSKELSDDNPRGITNVKAIQTDDGYSFDLAGIDEHDLAETVKLYWLPWKQCTAQTVSIEELNASGCDYFMTSELSGCRLSVTEKYISHIAYLQESGVTKMQTKTQRGRDVSELREINDKFCVPANAIKRRRVLSVSPEQIYRSDLDKISDNVRYRYNDQHGTVVFGYRDHGKWTLKYFERTKGRDYPKGRWHDLKI